MFMLLDRLKECLDLLEKFEEECRENFGRVVPYSEIQKQSNQLDPCFTFLKRCCGERVESSVRAIRAIFKAKLDEAKREDNAVLCDDDLHEQLLDIIKALEGWGGERGGGGGKPWGGVLCDSKLGGAVLVKIGDFEKRVDAFPFKLVLGRCDPPDKRGPSYLCIKDEEGRELYKFVDIECRYGCGKSDPEGCCHRRHVVVEVLPGCIKLRKAEGAYFPWYICEGGNCRPVEEHTVPVGEGVLLSLAGTTWSKRAEGRFTSNRPYVWLKAVGGGAE